MDKESGVRKFYKEVKDSVTEDDKPQVLFKYTPGKPTKYNEQMPGLLIAHMAKGYSYKSFAGIIGVNLDTLYHWEKIYLDWKEAKSHGRILEMAMWEKIHIRCAATGKGNATAIMWAQKNKFPEDYRADNTPSVVVNNTAQNLSTMVWDDNAEKKLRELEAKTIEISAIKDDDILNLL